MEQPTGSNPIFESNFASRRGVRVPPALSASLLGVALAILACAQIDSPGEAPRPAAWTAHRLSDAARTALRAKREGLSRRGPKAFTAPDEAREFFLAQRLAPGQRSYPMQHLRDLLDEIRFRERQSRPLGGAGARAGT